MPKWGTARLRWVQLIGGGVCVCVCVRIMCVLVLSLWVPLLVHAFGGCLSGGLRASHECIRWVCALCALSMSALDGYVLCARLP